MQVLSIGQTLLVYVIIGAAMATSLVLFAMEAAAWRLKARRKQEQEEQHQQHPLLWWQQQEHQQSKVKRYHQVRINWGLNKQPIIAFPLPFRMSIFAVKLTKSQM